jgi:hyperosmotically inducible periplasmic protein
MNTTRTWVIVAATAMSVAVLPACSVMRDQQSVGTYVDDTTLTTRVKAKFADDPAVSALSISVETFKGLVQLSGFAKSGEEKAAAERLARSVSGVSGVKNDIVVRS